MDKALGSIEGLHIADFAGVQGVCEKTVRRDLTTFELDLGQAIACELDSEGRYVWRYTGGEWLFVDNLPRWVRDAVVAAGRRG